MGPRSGRGGRVYADEHVGARFVVDLLYLVVPDERIDEFYAEWDAIRATIRERVREHLEKPGLFVYVRMRAASEVTDGR